VLAAAHRCLWKRAWARPRYSAHAHEAVRQSPWVTTCVCLCDKRENGAKLTGQKWPKTSGGTMVAATEFGLPTSPAQLTSNLSAVNICKFV